MFGSWELGGLLASRERGIGALNDLLIATSASVVAFMFKFVEGKLIDFNHLHE